MAIDPFDPWYLYDFWALRGKYGEEEKRQAQMREKIRMEERDKFYIFMDISCGVLLAIGIIEALVAVWAAIFR